MSKNKYIEVEDIPILKGYFILICTDNFEWFNKKFNSPDALDGTNYACFMNSEYKQYDAYIIVLNLWKDTEITHAVIAHEVNHLVNCLLKNRDWVKLKNDEPESYIKEYFVNRVYRILKKMKLIKRIKNYG